MPKEKANVPVIGLDDGEEVEEARGVAVRIPESVSQGGRNSWICEETADTAVMG